MTMVLKMSRQRTPERDETDREYLRQIGSNIREARKRKGYSQEEFAEVASFSRSYYTEIETGKRNLSLLNFLKIVEALDVDPNTLIGPVRHKSR